jgi:hypothetical protein
MAPPGQPGDREPRILRRRPPPRHGKTQARPLLQRASRSGGQPPDRSTRFTGRQQSQEELPGHYAAACGQAQPRGRSRGGSPLDGEGMCRAAADRAPRSSREARAAPSRTARAYVAPTPSVAVSSSGALESPARSERSIGRCEPLAAGANDGLVNHRLREDLMSSTTLVDIAGRRRSCDPARLPPRPTAPQQGSSVSSGSADGRGDHRRHAAPPVMTPAAYGCAA